MSLASQDHAKAVMFATRSLAGLLLLAAAVALMSWMIKSKPSALSRPNSNSARQVEAIETRNVSVTISHWGYGSAQAMRAARLSAEVPALVVERPAQIEAGAFIEKGDLVVQLDQTDYLEMQNRSQQAIAALQAQLQGLNEVETRRLGEQLRLAKEATRLTQSELDRLREARLGGAAKAIEIERMERQLANTQREEDILQQRVNLIPSRSAQLEAQLAGERAQLVVASKNLERTHIVAPFAGYIQEVFVETGELLSTGDPVARLVDLSRIEIPLRVPVSAASDVQPGDAVTIRAESGRPGEWRGSVVRIAPEADQVTRTIPIYIEVEQPARVGNEAHLRPGQFVMGTITTSRQVQAIVVPRRAVIEDRVLIEEPQGVARSAEIEVLLHVDARFPEIDPQENEWAVIAGGLRSGQRVIISNLDELDPGMAVETRLPEARQEGAGT